MLGTNKYFLVDHTELPNITKTVSDIAQLFFLQNTTTRAEASWLVELQMHRHALRIVLHNPQGIVEYRDVPIQGGKITNALKKQLLLLLNEQFKEKMIEWGILRGVRPVKLVQNFIAKGLSDTEMDELLRKEFLVHEKKITSLLQIAHYQNQLTAAYGHRDIAVYINIPFCNTKCTYCSFPSSIITDDVQELDLFLQAIERDVQNVLQLADEYKLNVICIYVGGGTPTSLPTPHFLQLTKILRTLTTRFTPQEFTFEAGRVDSLDYEKLQALHELGITRISLNPQTFSNATLRQVGRNHSAEDFLYWYEYIKTNYSWEINTDIILGLPHENLTDVYNTVRQIEKLQPNNFTIHTLAYKKNTALYEDVERYYQKTHLVGQMMEVAEQTAQAMGMHPYYLYRQRYILGNMENIGYTRENQACLYNVLIMQEKHNVLGIGPTATTKIVNEAGNLERFFMPKNISIYLENIQEYIEKRAATIAANI